MPAGNVIPYTIGLQGINRGLIDLDSDTIVCVLLTSSYTPGRTTHSTWADMSAAEVATGGGYTAGGEALANKAVSHSSGTVTFDADDVSWSSATITAKYAALVKRAGGSLASGDLLVAYVDLDTGGGSVTSTASTFAVAWNAAGIFTATGNAS
jgi:hypothetical protein